MYTKSSGGICEYMPTPLELNKLTIGLYGSYVLHHLDRLRIWMCSRVLVIQTIHIRHEEQQVRMDHGGCDGRQGIIVTEFDLRNCQGIVFVHNRDDPHIQ